MFVVSSRQERPNLPETTCPFCPGGLEAPEPYDVRWFPNRWPAMPGARCEVVLYTPEHDATFWSLGVDGARKVVDLWADRSAALGSRDDLAYVLVFENRGAEVGATISHPHGQIYAFDRSRTSRCWSCERGERFSAVAERLVATAPGWRAWVPEAPIFPYALTLAPDVAGPRPAVARRRRPRRARRAPGRRARAHRPAVRRADPVHALDPPAAVRRRRLAGGAPPRRDRLALARAGNVPRFVAAGELGSGVFFNPVVPEQAAQALRDAL